VLANYRLLPRWSIAPVHVLLPLAELAIGVGMIARPLFAAPAAALLLLVFAAAMAVNLRRGRSDIDCGCHQSVLRQRLSWTLVWRNAALSVLALLAAVPSASSSAGAWLTGAGAGLGLFALYGAMNSLWAVGPVTRRRIRFAGVSP
jgi:Methylamine utilisation protein MauE